MTRKFWVDLLERVIWTAIEAAGAVVLAQQDFNILTLKTAAVAAGLAVVKCLIAANVGNRDSASSAPSV